MAVRPDEVLQNAVIQKWTVTAAAAATAYMPLTLTAEKTARDSTAGENCSAIALQAGSAGDLIDVALLTGGAILPVKVGSAGATYGKYATVGTTGLTDKTIGGGTTLVYIAGKFNQTGTSGDIVGLVVGQFAAVSS